MKVHPAFLLGLVAVCPATLAKPPTTPQHDVVDTYHGIQIHDPYRWLEDADALPVRQWINTQNSYTEGVMGGFKDAKAIAERVGALALTSTQRNAPEIAGDTLFYLRQTPPQPQPVLVAEAWPKGEAKVLVDPNSDANGAAITNYWPSPDGKRVAYGTAEGGGEETTIHFVDVADGKVAADALPFAGGGTTPQALVWDADGKGVTYVRLPLPDTVAVDKTQFNAALFHHAFGTPASTDMLSFGKNLSPVAEYTLMSSDHGKYAAAFVHYGDGNPDALYLRKEGEWKSALGTDSNLRAAASVNNAAVWDGERLLVIAYQYAPRGKLLAVDAEGHSRVLVAQDEWAMNGVAPIKGGFLLTQVNGPDWRVQQYSSDGHLVRTVPLPQSGIGVGAIASTVDSPNAMISYSGWSQPTRWVQYDAGSGALKTVFEVTAAGDYSKLKTWRLDAKSADGTLVPVTVVALADAKPDGKRPLILSAYGGYGLTQSPRFLGPYLAWLERGGVYALANIRGGGEFGEGWHEDGKLANKQHCFDDLHAAAQALVEAKWTDSAHLGILGGSNGGLLMGAALTQHPADYRAVVSFVGVYDMLRSELWPNGQYNVSEYGTVANAADFDWLRKYSPLHNVKKDTAYPAVLLITGVNDPRVAPWQSRKFAAALQAANTSPHPVVLLTRMNEGHGVTASFSQRVGNTGAAFGFFAEQLGLGPVPAQAGKAMLPCIEQETAPNPRHAVIWLHGLGADGNDFAPIVPELVDPKWPPLRFVFPHAPVRPITINGGMAMRAWYDISGQEIAQRQDEAGIRASIGSLDELIEREVARGVPTQNILLAGFSQGGAIVLSGGVRHAQRLGGIVALSTYLPMAEKTDAEASAANRVIPIFMAHGMLDPTISHALGEMSRDYLKTRGYPVDWHAYPMAHQVCMEEIADLRRWMTARLA